MATKKISLDAGHGLKTPGKQTPDSIKEWTLNDKVRDKVVAILEDYNVDLVFPDGNEGNTDESLSSRKAMYIKEKVDAAVSIHHNAFKAIWGLHTGVETYVDKNCTAKDLALANAIQTRLAKYTGLKNRGVKKANYTVINQNTIPAVLVEGGFMDSRKDHPVITSDKGQAAYAQAVAEGLIEFLGLKKLAIKTQFYVKVFNVKKDDVLNIRETPSAKAKITGKLAYNDPNIYTIVEVKGDWGRLKSGLGWINLHYTKRVN